MPPPDVCLILVVTTASIAAYLLWILDAAPRLRGLLIFVTVVAVVAAVLLLGTFVGVLNAGLVIGLRVHPLIVTLGMGAMLQGVTLLYAMGPVGKVPRTFTFLAYGRIAGLPLGATIAVMLCVVVALFLRYLPL